MASTATQLVQKSLLLTCLTVLPLSAHAGVYKWVDENGTVHYSDSHPNNVKAESMKLHGVGGKKGGGGSPQEKANALDAAKQKQLEQQARQLQEETAKRELEAKCQVIRDNLQKIETTSRIGIIENGEKRYLTSDEINSQKEKYKSMLEQECS